VQLKEQVSAVDEIKDKVQLIARLETGMQRHDVWMIHARQDISLRAHILRLLLLQDDGLLHHLQRKDAAIVLSLYLEHFAKRTLEDSGRVRESRQRGRMHCRTQW
jgi:hypothetical protein